MTTLTIPIDEPTAAAYAAASDDEREQLAQRAAVLVRLALLDHRSPSERFQQIADVLGWEARSNGWTDDMDEALLRGDFDHDE